MNKLVARLAALLLAVSAAAPATAQLPLPGGSLIVTLTSPSQGSTVSGTIPVSAGVSIVGLLTVSRVEFFADGGFIGSDSGAPYSVSWNTTSVGNGSHTLSAVAVDVLGVRWTSNSVAVNVSNGPPPDTTAPNVSIASPANGATVSGTINVTASASDNVGVAGVRFLLDGVVRADDTSSPYSISWDTTTAGNGSHTLTAVARDAAGNTRTSSPVSVTVSNGPPPDTTPPSVSISSPANGATVSGNTNVTASAADNVGVVGVQFRFDGGLLGPEDTSSPYAVTWNTALTGNGAHTLTAVARDAAGNTRASNTVNVTVANGPPPDTTPPSVSITSPANGATVSGTVNVSANASDNVGVSGVQFQLDGANAGPVLTTTPYSIPWDTTTASAGTHTIAAIAADAAGNRTTSAAVAVTVANGGTGAARFEETDAAVVAAGTWSRIGPEIAAFSGGTAGVASASGASVAFTFTGSTVSWVGLRCNVCGIATASIDGRAPQTVDTAGPGSPDGSLASEVVFSASGLDATTSHTLTITVTGDTHSGGVYVVVDAFDVTGGTAGSVTRIEQDNAAVSYAGTWVRDGASTMASGGTFSESNAAGATLALSFTGSEVRWLGYRYGGGGIARVSVDGTFVGEVNTYSASPALGAVFTASGLSSGPHTLTLDITGTRDPAAVDSWVVVDAFDVVIP